MSARVKNVPRHTQTRIRTQSVTANESRRREISQNLHTLIVHAGREDL